MKSLREKGTGTLSSIAGIIYFLIGFIQFICLYAYITESWFDIFIISLVLSIVFAFIPVVGSVLGFLGATEYFHWNILLSIVLFFGSYVVIGILLVLAKER